MKKVKVQIKGKSGLLMNSPKSMLDKIQQELSSRTSKINPKEEADKLAYKKEDGELYVPAEAIKGCMINAASYKKFGKYAAKPFIAGGLRIVPREIGLGTKEYDLDIRTVVIQRARVVKVRPLLKEWKIDFTIEYDENLIQNDKLIKPILEEGGQRVGILDFRPAKLGDFGTFEITKWKPE